MTSKKKQIQYYSKIQVQTATHARLICMLHEKCEQLIRQTIDRGDSDSRSRLDHAQNIIVELERALDDSDQVGKSLYLLYDYCYCSLETGTSYDSRKALQVISSLRETFNRLNKRPVN
jgi:flagellar biosynthetic protein FliS